jgi:translation initiation factor 6 (eIF-6)
MSDGDGNPVEAGRFLGDDGAFQEGWQSLAFPDDTDPHKTDQTLANIKDFRSMARQVVSGESTIGKLSGGRDFAILPNDQSDEAEIKTYRTKRGVPETAADYKLNELQLPEGLPKDDKLVEHMAGILHKAGATSGEATEVFNGYVEFIKKSLEAADTQEKLDNAAANTALRAKLGSTYDKTLQNIAAVVNAFGNDIDAAETAALIKALPNDSFAAQLLGKMAERLVSEKGLTGSPERTDGQLTPADAMTKFHELTTDPYYMTATPKDKTRNQQYHDELVQKGEGLMKLATAKAGAS